MRGGLGGEPWAEFIQPQEKWRNAIFSTKDEVAEM